MMTKKNIVEPGRTPALGKSGSCQFEKKLETIVSKFETRRQTPAPPVKPNK